MLSEKWQSVLKAEKCSNHWHCSVQGTSRMRKKTAESTMKHPAEQSRVLTENLQSTDRVRAEYKYSWNTLEQSKVHSAGVDPLRG